MDSKVYLQLTGAIFALVALAHLVRAMMGLPIVIAGWIAPVWLSWLAFVISGALSWLGWNLANRG
jgi:cytochrome c biogenesis protein CcdA